MSVNVSICYEFNNCFLLEVVVQDVMFFKFVCDFKSISFKMIGKWFILVRYYKIGFVVEFVSLFCEDKQYKLYFFYIFKVFSLILEKLLNLKVKKNLIVSFFLNERF